MEVVKRNLYSIICGVIAIIAVILVFYPLGGMIDDLQSKLDESGNDYTTIRSLQSKEHTAPMVDIENAEQRKIDKFPTRKWIEAGEAAVTKVQEQSLQLLQKAMDMNSKAPLVPDAFVGQGAGPAFSVFKNQYYQKLHSFRQQMNATSAPTQEEVTRRLEAMRNEMMQHGGAEFARSDFDMELKMKELTLPDELGRERAASASIYVSAEPGGTGMGGGNLSGETPELAGLKSFDVHHPGIPTRSQLSSPSQVDVWAAQLGLWVQEDVVQAIVATNGNVQGIPNATIKRLIEIKVPKEYITKLGRVPLVDATGVAIRPDQNAPPPPPPTEEAAPMDVGDPNKPPKDPKQSATGRIGNDLYDVIHFSVIVDCDAARFRDFMANLVSNRHITILTVDLEGVNRDAEFQALYFYGDNPVVRVRLNCEALFFREWTLPLMPEQVKKMLNITPPNTGLATDTMALQ